MEDRIRKQLEKILEEAEIEEQSETLLRQSLEIYLPSEDGPWLKSMFRLAAIFLEMAYGNRESANSVLPWLLFSLGMAYERYNVQKTDYNGSEV